MRKCAIYMLMVLQIGGGFSGVCAAVSRILLKTSTFENTWVSNIPVVLVFVFGITAGLALVERFRLGVVLSAVYQLLQVPTLWSSLLSYRFYSGLHVGIAWSQGKVRPWIEFGSFYGLRLFGYKGSWLVGINLLALALLVFLLFELRRMNRSRGRQSEIRDVGMMTSCGSH